MLLPAKETGLPNDLIAMAHQIRAISKERLNKIIGEIKSESIKESIK